MISNSPDRYARHEMLHEIGAAGQRKLSQSSVLIVGCGALGGFQAELLARAGVGRLRIVDPDIVELHNLHRQILYMENDAESKVLKVEAAAKRLGQVNSGVDVETRPVRFNAQDAQSLLAGVDIVLDASDNFETRYLLNDVCIKSQTPWVYGGVVGTSGMVMPVLPGLRGPCLRCVIPAPPEPGTVPTADTLGVLNCAVAVIASLQTTLAMRVLLGNPPAEIGLFHANVWNMSFDFLKVQRNDLCPCCGLGGFEFLDAPV